MLAGRFKTHLDGIGDFNLITHCAICQNELNEDDKIRMNLDSSTCEADLDIYSGSELIRQIIVYEYTYSGMSDLCSSCTRSLNMYIKNNNISTNISAYEAREHWYLNRFKNSVRKIK